MSIYVAGYLSMSVLVFYLHSWGLAEELENQSHGCLCTKQTGFSLLIASFPEAFNLLLL